MSVTFSPHAAHPPSPMASPSSRSLPLSARSLSPKRRGEGTGLSEGGLPANLERILHTLETSREFGDSNPEINRSVDVAMKARGPGEPANPGVRFGYWASKQYFMKNIGYVKDYRSARQLLLDAESAMMKSFEAERWKYRYQTQELTRERAELLERAKEKDALILRLLTEKERAFEVFERKVMSAEDGRSRAVERSQTLQVEIRGMTDRLSAMQTNVETMRGSLIQMQEKYSAVMAQLVLLEDRNRVLTAEAGRNDAELKDLRTRVMQAESAYHEKTKQHLDTSRLIAHLEDQVRLYQDSSMRHADTNAKLTVRLAELEGRTTPHARRTVTTGTAARSPTPRPLTVSPRTATPRASLSPRRSASPANSGALSPALSTHSRGSLRGTPFPHRLLSRAPGAYHEYAPTSPAAPRGRKVRRSTKPLRIEYDPTTGRVMPLPAGVRKVKKKGKPQALPHPTWVTEMVARVGKKKVAFILHVNGTNVLCKKGEILLTAAGWKAPWDVAPGDCLYTLRPGASGAEGDPKHEEVPVAMSSFVVIDKSAVLPEYSQHNFITASLSGDSLRARSPDLPPSAESPTALWTQPHERLIYTVKGPQPIELGSTTPNDVGWCPPGREYLLRPPEGMCGFGNLATPAYPPKVTSDPLGNFLISWDCCRGKGLADNQLMPSHHSNKSVSPLECPILAVIDPKA